MRDWCHLYAILIELLQQNTFNTFQLSVTVNITWDSYATCKAVSFYIRGFIYTRSYSSPTKQMAGLYIWYPTLWHAAYHKPAVYTLSVGVMVLSLIQISIDRQQSINQKLQIKGNCWEWKGFVYGYFAFANFALILFMIYVLTYNCQTSQIITLSELKDKLTSSTSKSYRRQKLPRVYFVNWTKINCNDDFRFHTYNMCALFTII